MKHGTTRSVGNRVIGGMSRATVEKVDDTKLLQEVQLRGFSGEVMDTIEVNHPYGFFSVPKGPSEQQGQGGGGGQGGSGQTTGIAARKKKAEMFGNFQLGDRGHGVMPPASDRRFRPNNNKEGETGIHDDQMQQVYLSRDRVVMHVPKGKEVHLQTEDGTHVFMSKDKVKLQRDTLSVTIKGGQVLLGSETGATHRVSTEHGLSSNVFATIDEKDTKMDLSPWAKHSDPGTDSMSSADNATGSPSVGSPALTAH